MQMDFAKLKIVITEDYWHNDWIFKKVRERIAWNHCDVINYGLGRDKCIKTPKNQLGKMQV